MGEIRSVNGRCKAPKRRRLLCTILQRFLFSSSLRRRKMKEKNQTELCLFVFSVKEDKLARFFDGVSWVKPSSGKFSFVRSLNTSRRFHSLQPLSQRC